MSTAKHKGKTVSKVIAYIVIILVLAGVFGVIFRFTGGLTSDFKTFYVNIDGKDVLTTAEDFETTPTKPLKVNVKYTFGDAGGNVSGYSVKVVPNNVEGKNFDFVLDGQYYSFQAETDLTDGFDIEREKDSFSITPKGGVDDVLQAVYPNGVITDCTGKGYLNMYTLIVTSYNGKSSVEIHFSAYEEASEVYLSEEVIVF